MTTTKNLLALLFFTASSPQVAAFVAPSFGRPSFALFDATTPETSTSSMSITLEKPLGLVLEEVTEGQPEGVYVLELADGGSAADMPELVGKKLSSVMGQDVTTSDFDSVMELLVNAPSPVGLEFVVEDEDDDSGITDYPIGTPVSIVVRQRDGKPEVTIEAKVGDNLRQTLLDNNVEVYRGLKQKLGNCGGGGQCTFCAVNFIDDSDGWAPRSDYEDQRLKRSPKARLSCLNNIQGPATIEM